MTESYMLENLTTELPHDLTSSIDLLSCEEGMRLISEVEKEIFTSFNDKSLESMHELAKSFLTTINRNGNIIISGSGTSGRIAVHSSNEYNKLLKKNVFKPMISGGYFTLLKAKERAEDNILLGKNDLNNLWDNNKSNLYVAISSSGNAAYSINPINDITGKNCAVITFNDIKLLKNHKNYNILKKVENEGFLVNLPLGSEAITGSTRLKGGTATQIILDLVFNYTLIKDKSVRDNYFKKENIESILKEYSRAHNLVKSNISELAKIALSVKESFLNNAKTYYLTDSILGKIALMDSSECMPTFGIDYEKITSFIDGGWNKFLEPEQLNQIDPTLKNVHRIDLGDFRKMNISSKDTVIILYNNISKELMLSKDYAKENNCKIYSIAINSNTSLSQDVTQNDIITLDFKSDVYDHTFFDKLIAKWSLNLISTEAFILSGKTWKNHMIDLKLSNNKLINRAERIISKIITHEYGKSVSEEEIKSHININAMKYLGRNDASVSYSEEFMYVDKLLPTTLLTLNGINYDDARNLLNSKPIIRQILQDNLLK
ncbi:MAG: hypothetical protein ACP5N1_01380 [Candidatus Woesearchaeota archaeon]